jgi:hypothetical protein
VCFHHFVTAIPHGRNLGLTLLTLVPVFLVLTLGLAFTIFGEIAALLAVVSLMAGVVILFRVRREQ